MKTGAKLRWSRWWKGCLKELQFFAVEQQGFRAGGIPVADTLSSLERLPLPFDLQLELSLSSFFFLLHFILKKFQYIQKQDI